MTVKVRLCQKLFNQHRHLHPSKYFSMLNVVIG